MSNPLQRFLSPPATQHTSSDTLIIFIAGPEIDELAQSRYPSIFIKIRASTMRGCFAKQRKNSPAFLRVNRASLTC